MTHRTAASPTRAALLGLSLAYFMVLLDTTVLAVAEPDLIRRLHTDVAGAGWATTAYTMTLAAALVLGGAVADRMGAGRVLRTGTVGFGIVSVVCALAPSIAVLATSRAVLGLCAAAVVPSSMAVIAHLFPVPAARARAIAVWAAVSGTAMAAGPVLGGVLVDAAGWRTVFALNPPLAVVVVLLCRADRVAVPARAHRIDPRPHLALAGALAAATFAVIEAGRGAVATATTAAVLGVAFAGATAVLDRRSTAPVVPVALRRSGGLWSGMAWGAAANYVLTTVLFVVPLRTSGGPAAVGVLMLPLTLLVALNPLVTGIVVARHGPLLPIRLGLAALAAGAAGLAAAYADGADRAAIGLALLGCGLGVSWTLPALAAYVVGQAPAGTAGSVGGLVNAARQVGATLGAAVAAATLSTSARGLPGESALLLAAVLAAAALGGALTARAAGSSDRASGRTWSRSRRVFRPSQIRDVDGA